MATSPRQNTTGRPTRTAALAVTLVLAIGAPACGGTEDESGMPNSTDTSVVPTSQAMPELEEVFQVTPDGHGDKARAMVSCMQEADVPAILEESYDPNEAFFDIDPDYPVLIAWGKDAVSFYYGDNPDEAEWNYWEAKYHELDSWTTPPFLFVAETDHSEAFAACIDQTGYIPVEYLADSVEELAHKQKVAQAGAEWATCARENGYPAIKDPNPPKADNWETSPAVLLPEDITPDELRYLLVVCPNFDREAEEASHEAWKQSGFDSETAQSPIHPLIEVEGSDIAVFDGPDDPALKRLQALWEVLHEKENAYHDERHNAWQEPCDDPDGCASF